MMRLLFVILIFPVFIFSQSGSEYHYEYLRPIHVHINSFYTSPSYAKSTHIALDYCKLNKPKKAVEWFERATDFKPLDREDLYQYALQLVKCQYYDKAILVMKMYRKDYGKDELIDNYLKTLENIDILLKNTGEYQVLLSPVSQVGIPEVSPTPFKEGFVYLKPYHHFFGGHLEGKKINHNGFFDLVYFSVEDSSNRYLTSNLNTKFHEGPSCFTNEDSTIYFSRNNYYQQHLHLGRKNHVSFQLYKSDYEDGKWNDEQLLDINLSDYSFTDPWVSKDQKFMFFSSNKSNGFGGYDIYYSIADSPGEFKISKNLGPMISSAGNEGYPWFDEERRLLYFSSDGIGGLGGMDIFVAVLDEEFNVQEVQNLGVPVNSSDNDISFSLSSETSGWIASDRRGDLDIYEIKKVDCPLKKRGKIIDGETL